MSSRRHVTFTQAKLESQAMCRTNLHLQGGSECEAQKIIFCTLLRVSRIWHKVHKAVDLTAYLPGPALSLAQKGTAKEGRARRCQASQPSKRES